MKEQERRWDRKLFGWEVIFNTGLLKQISSLQGELICLLGYNCIAGITLAPESVLSRYKPENGKTIDGKCFVYSGMFDSVKCVLQL